MKIILRLLLLFSLLLTAVAAQAAPRKVFVFDGKIRAIDGAARTFTLQTNIKPYTFSVTEQTRIIHNGMFRSFGDLKSGQDAEVEMTIGPDGKGIALSVNLTAVGPAAVESLFSATTPSGKTLSAGQLKPLVLYRTWPSTTARVFWRLKVGIFLLEVRADGTVAKVEQLQSTGHSGLDGDLKRAFLKWRFRPNSVSSVRVPAHYSITNRWSQVP
jgi:TonB family protein